LVTIHVLEGHLIVETDASDTDLRAGQVLILNPNVAHAVRALDASAMLLTVVMDDHR
jgi:quercetin dioxygenase-like cupin family protein